MLELPPSLRTALGNEKPDFAVKARRRVSRRTALGGVGLGIFLLAFMSIFVAGFFGPLLMGEEVHFESNGVPTVAGPGNLGPLLLPGIVVGIFVLVALAVLAFGILGLVREGGWFVATPTRLIIHTESQTRSIDWEQFSGDIEALRNGDIVLALRTGKMVSRKRGPDRFVPDKIEMAGVDDVDRLAELCRRRIKENDPTPPQPL